MNREQFKTFKISLHFISQVLFISQALTLIEQCSDAFGDDKDLAAVKEAYQYLKSQNVSFPARNLDDMVAIHTPRPVMMERVGELLELVC